MKKVLAIPMLINELQKCAILPPILSAILFGENSGSLKTHV